MVEEALADAKERMEAAVRVLKENLTSVRTGRATPALVDRITVEYYGVQTPLQQLAAISVPEPRVLAIRPFDQSTLKEVERSIYASDLGLTPSNDGKIIRLILPMLTEDRRRDLIKVSGGIVEDARVAIRNIRRDVLNDLRDMEKEKMITEDELSRAQKRVQDLTDKHVDDMNVIGKRKEEEIMQV